MKLERLLGRGGMGEVWLAHEPRTSRRVAVKVPRRDVEEPRWTQSLFADELRVLHELRGVEGVPQLFWSGVIDGLPFGVMQHVEGPTLREALRTCGRPSRAVAARIVDALSLILRDVHARGVLHRDLKPTNVLLEDGHPVLIDFGVAHASGSDGAELGVACGALDYSSPEQLLGDELDALSTDLWSLAVVAYELVTGHRPFRQEGVRRHCEAVLQARFERTGSLALDAFFERALAPRRAARFASLDVLLNAWRSVMPQQATAREVREWLAPSSRLALAA